MSSFNTRYAQGMRAEETAEQWFNTNGFTAYRPCQQLPEKALRKHGNKAYAKFQRDLILTLPSGYRVTVEVKSYPYPVATMTYPNILVGNCQHWDSMKFTPQLVLWIPGNTPSMEDALLTRGDKPLRKAWVRGCFGFEPSYGVPRTRWKPLLECLPLLLDPDRVPPYLRSRRLTH